MAKPPTNLTSALKLKHRWFQLSLRTMFVLVAALCIVLSVWAVPAEQQRRAVAAIEAVRGHAYYVEGDDSAPDSPLNAYLRRRLPRDYFDEVREVGLPYDKVELALPHLQVLARAKKCIYNVSTADLGLARLKGLTRLDLDLVGCGLTDDSLALVGQLAGLERLDISFNPVTDAGLAHLSKLTGLEALALADTEVSDHGLACLEGLTQLRELDLHYTWISDDGLTHLKRLAKLEALRLDRNYITDAGLAHLRALTSLKELRLRDTQVTRSQVERLREALPNCEIWAP